MKQLLTKLQYAPATAGRRQCLALLVLLSALFVTDYAAAQQSIEEVVVTARQREELLQDVPASITVFTAEQIENAGIQRPEDFIQLTPGVSVVNTAEVGDMQVNIRGINTSRDAETNFALVVDGVLLTNPNAFNRELQDIAQIEVLKGPQGALYGRNAAAGAILIQTKKPTDEFEATVKVGGGNDNLVLTQAVVSGPLLTDNLRGRLAFSRRDFDGNYRNDFLNEDNVDDFENFVFDGRLLYEPNDDLSVDIRSSYGEVDTASIGFNAAIHLLDAAGATSVPAFALDVNDHEFFYRNNVDPENEQENFNFSLKSDYDAWDWGSLTAIFSYNNQENFFIADGTSAAFGLYNARPHCLESYAARRGDTPLPSPFFFHPSDLSMGFLPPYSPTTCDGYQYQERNQEDYNIELRLTSRGDQQLRWIAGFAYNNIEREVVVAQGEDTGGEIIARAYNPPGSSSPTDLLYDDLFNTDVYAVFGQLAYDLRPELELSVALRYDREEREVTNRVPNVLAANLNTNTMDTPDVNDPINPAFRFADTIDDRDATFSQFQPKLSLNWKALEQVSLFASYGIGFRSGGFNSQGSRATIEAFYRGLTNPFTSEMFDLTVRDIRDEFEEEVSMSFEAGFRSNYLDGRLNLNGAVYHTEIDDMQFFEFLVGPFGLLRTVTNVDEVSINGLELDATLQAADNIAVYTAFSYIDGEIKENANRPESVGNEVPYAPEFTINLGLRMQQQISDYWSASYQADWVYTGATWFHTIQGEILPNQFTAFGFGRGDFSLAERDPFGIMNVRAILRSEDVTATLWARNLFDREYLEEVIPAPEFGGSFVHAGAARSFGIDLSYSF